MGRSSYVNGELEEKKLEDSPFQRMFKNSKLPMIFFNLILFINIGRQTIDMLIKHKLTVLNS